MTTARERMLQLSPLPSGNTARAHFLAIQEAGSITTIKVAEKILVSPASSSVSASLDSASALVTMVGTGVKITDGSDAAVKNLIDDKIVGSVAVCHKK